MSNLSSRGGGGGAGPLPHIHGVPGIGDSRNVWGFSNTVWGSGTRSHL